MKYCYLLLCIVFYSCKTVSVSESNVKQSIFSYKVDSLSVAKTLKTLSSDEMQGRQSGTKGGEIAADYLTELLQQYNVKPYFKTYRDTLSNFDVANTAFNIVGVIEGNDVHLKNEYVILGAHYDHIGINKTEVNGDFINNGANDDASGVTAVAELVKYFGTYKTNKRSILVAFFAAEESGLLGSFHLANLLRKKNFNLYTMLNFEMIGVPMTADYTAYITGYNKSNMAEKINEYSGKKLVGYFPMEFQYQLFLRSDNFPFFKEFNVPCQTICTFDFKNFEYYHHVKDEFELMDVSHMTNFIQEVIPVVEKMANATTKEIVLNK